MAIHGHHGLLFGSASALPVVTWNPAVKGSTLTLSSGNLVVQKNSLPQYSAVRATHAHPATDAGGFYFEVYINGSATSPFILIGVANASQTINDGRYIGDSVNSWGYYQDTGAKYTNATGTAYAAGYTTADVIGVLLKNGKLYFRKNGTWLNSADVDAETGAAFTGLTGDLYPAVSLYRTSPPTHQVTGRFKASDFSGSIPTGASAWGA